MKSDETKSIVRQWFLPVALFIAFILTYNDVISGISAKLNAPKVREENKIKNYVFEKDIQRPIEQAKNPEELKKVCSDSVMRALDQAKYLTGELKRENAIHDKKWRIQTEARWRRSMLEYLEEESVASIEIAWKTEELCRLEEYMIHDKKSSSAIAEFQKLVVERGLEDTHLQKFQSQLGVELEEATEKFNDWNEKRLTHLASYTFDVTYERSPWAWLMKGPIGSRFKEFFSDFIGVFDFVGWKMKTMSKSLQKTFDAAKKLTSDNAKQAKEVAANVSKSKGVESKAKKVDSKPLRVQPQQEEIVVPQKSQKYPETNATRDFFPGETAPK